MSLSTVSKECSFCACAVLGRMALYDGMPYYARILLSYVAEGLFIAEIMIIYVESRTCSQSSKWHRENSREFENFWKGLRTILYSVNEEVYLPK